METLEDKLRSHTKEINDIMLLAQTAFRVFEQLKRPTPYIEMEVINSNQFLKYTSLINWQIFVTELSKLFKNSNADCFNLHRFIGKFKKGMEYEQIKSIDQVSVQIWEDSLALSKKSIDNLLLQRDKLYSHTDKNRSQVKNELSFKDAKELINIVQRIASEIYQVVFGSYISFDPIGDPAHDLQKILDVLTADRQRLLDGYIAHCKEVGIDPKDVGL